MLVPCSLQSFSHQLASALAEALELHSDHLRGEKIYGALLVPAADNLSPSFRLLDDSDTVGMDPDSRWAPDGFCVSVYSPRLSELCRLSRGLRENWSGTREEWHRASLTSLSAALGSRPVRRAFRRLGAEPILCIFDHAGHGIEPTTFATLNAGRESEPFYLQAARFLR